MSREGRTRLACAGCQRIGYETRYSTDRDPTRYYGWDRPAKGLCDNCTGDLAEAKKLVEREKAIAASRTSLKPFRINNDMPYARHTKYEFRGPVSGKLQELVRALGVEPIIDEDRDNNAPRVFTRPSTSSSMTYYDKHILLNPEHAALLDALEHAMQDQIDCAYTEGFNEGRNLLKALAEGKMTTRDFDDESARKQ